MKIPIEFSFFKVLDHVGLIFGPQYLILWSIIQGPMIVPPRAKSTQKSGA